MWGSIAAIGAGLAVLGAGIGIGQIGGKPLKVSHGILKLQVKLQLQ